MKRIVFTLIMLGFVINCNSDNGTNPEDEIKEIDIIFRDAVETVTLNDLQIVELEGEQTVKLTDVLESVFFDSLIIKYPEIFVYRIIGSDGFYAERKGYGDNTWYHLQHGYLRLDTKLAIFEDGLEGIVKGHGVKDVAEIEILRKINVTAQTSLLDTSAVYLIDDLTEVIYSNAEEAEYDGEKGVKLSEIIGLLTDTPESFYYKLEGADGWISPLEFTWAEMQTAYFLTDMEKSKFNPDLGGKSRIRNLSNIIVIEPSE